MPLSEAVTRLGPGRLLLIVGEARDERQAAPLLQAAGDIEVWDLPETPHIQALRLHPEEWERRIIEFLDATLGRSA